MTVTYYVAEMETAEHAPDEARVDELMEALRAFHPALAATPEGHLSVIVTLAAKNLRYATRSALELLGALVDGTALTVLPESTRDQRLHLSPEPRLFTVAQVAAALGITVQGVRHRINTGTLPAVKKGRDWWVEPRHLTPEQQRRIKASGRGRTLEADQP